MIERLHEAGLKSEHARIAATIGSSFLAWAASLKAEKAGTDRAERWGTFADGASASSGLGNTLLHPLTATPGRASPWTPSSGRAHRTAGQQEDR